jgi:hypothetical protein
MLTGDLKLRGKVQEQLIHVLRLRRNSIRALPRVSTCQLLPHHPTQITTKPEQIKNTAATTRKQ